LTVVFDVAVDLVPDVGGLLGSRRLSLNPHIG
jgi:hypothetical protein